MKRIIAIILLTISPVVASPKVVGRPAPLPEERLCAPYILTNQCDKVKIIEWRGTVPSMAALGIINQTCNVVVEKFYPFVQKHGFSATNRVKPNYYLSLIPWKPYEEGYSYRNLNDNSYRFHDRPLFCNSQGGVCRDGETPLPLKGWTDRRHKISFIRNDIFTSAGCPNMEFQAILAHELFHVLSFESGVFDKHLSIIIEENLARKFTNELGYGDI